MKEIFKNFFYKITGGRPMEKLDYLFTDKIDNSSVFKFRDKFGRLWMANKKCSLFRVEIKREANEK